MARPVVTVLARTGLLLAGGILGTVVLAALYLGVMWIRLPSVAGYERGDPGETAFMRAEGCDVLDVRYRPLDEIDPRLACTVVWAEDRGFFVHDGVDWEALEDAARANWEHGGVRRGASTLAMQVARNLFLERARTPSRKLREIVLARRLHDRYGRRRMLELYLNVAEWAPCVYGAEAAAHHYFGHGAGVVDGAEATFLAAMLPRPGTPPGRERSDRRRMSRKQHALLTTMGRSGLAAPATIRAERAEIAALWRTPGAHAARVDSPAPEAWLTRMCGTVPLRAGPTE